MTAASGVVLQPKVEPDDPDRDEDLQLKLADRTGRLWIVAGHWRFSSAILPPARLALWPASCQCATVLRALIGAFEILIRPPFTAGCGMAACALDLQRPGQLSAFLPKTAGHLAGFARRKLSAHQQRGAQTGNGGSRSEVYGLHDFHPLEHCFAAKHDARRSKNMAARRPQTIRERRRR